MQVQVDQGEGHMSIEARLDASRCFIGRDGPLATLKAALAVQSWPFHLLYVQGRAGVGKTHLLHQVGAWASSAGERVLWMGYHQLEALRDRLAGQERYVVIIDNAQLRSEDAEDLTRTFGQIRTRCLLVMASRHPAPVRWRADGAWSWFARVHELEHFDEQETRLYVDARGVESSQASSLFRLTRGHPLTLALACSSILDSGDVDIERALSSALIDVVRSDSPRADAVLDAASVVRCTREDILAELLETSGARDAFRALHDVPFVVLDRDGLTPLPILRAAVVRDLRWRNPARLEQLRERARRYYLSRLEGGATDRHVLLRDLLYLFDESSADFVSMPVDDAMAHAATASFVAKLEGSVIEDVALELARAPYSYRRHCIDGELVALHRTSALAGEPSAEALCDHLAREAPLEPGARATVVTAWINPDMRAIRALLLDVVSTALSDDGLAVTFVTTSEPRCARILERCGAQRVAVEDSTRQTHACDWRRTPPQQWLERIASTSDTHDAPITPYAILTRHAFEDAVRHALRCYHQPAALRQNPLLCARVVAARLTTGRDPGHRATHLRQLLHDAAATLAASPRHAKLHRVVKRTYFDSAPSQEQAADSLDLPLSTYRRHLKRAIAEIADILWRSELGGA